MKKEYVLLSGIIIGLSLYLIMRNADKSYPLPDMPKVAKDAITKIEISKPGMSVMLSKKGDAWRILPQEYPADKASVNSMLDIIENFTLTEMVSESKNYIRYDLGDDKKISVKAWKDQSPAREFYAGKPAPTYQHTFVRLAADDRVYYAQGNFRKTFDQTTDTLRDKTVLAFDENDIREIKIAKEGKILTLSRTQASVEATAEGGNAPSAKKEPETIWKASDGKELTEKDLGSLLATLSSLRCESYSGIQKKEDIKVSPVCNIHLTGTGEHTLSIFAKTNKDSKEYLAVSSDNNYPFLLSVWKVDDRIIKPVDAILRKPELKK